VCRLSYEFNPPGFQGSSLNLNLRISNPNFWKKCPNLKSLALGPSCLNNMKDFQANVLPSMSLDRLTLQGYKEVINLSGMEKIIELDLRDLPYLVSLIGIGTKIKKVLLQKLPGIIDFSPLSACAQITINECPELKDLHFLENAKKVIIQDCIKLTSLKGLNRGNTVTVSKCQNLADINDLGSNKSVRIIDCPKIKKFYKKGKYTAISQTIKDFMVI
jgi:hypothetical protein